MDISRLREKQEVMSAADMAQVVFEYFKQDGRESAYDDPMRYGSVDELYEFFFRRIFPDVLVNRDPHAQTQNKLREAFSILERKDFIRNRGDGRYVLTATGYETNLDTEIESDNQGDEPMRQQSKIFIVHGSNHVIRNEIRIFLIDLGLQTVVMDATASGGRTLPEKFEDIARECQFAVFILSADDDLTDHSNNERIKRARQNVILEVGYFWGALGRRGNVAFLVDSAIEIPSDIQGIGYIPITADLGETKLKLRQELEAAGLL